MTCICE